MTTTARDKAERCFALARSTSFDGERANAIAQGTRIAEAAGLSLDLFDIPGRTRKAAPAGEASRSARYSARPGFGAWEFADVESDADALAEAIRRYKETARRQHEADFFRAFHDDGLRRHREAIKRQEEERERRRYHRERARLLEAVTILAAAGCSCARAPAVSDPTGKAWDIRAPKGSSRVSPEQLVELAAMARAQGLAR